MGLDLIELAMEVEETFGFSIPNEDVATLDSVGKRCDYIMAHRFEGRQQGCLTSVAFYKLRRALMSVLGIARSDVRLSSDLNAIIPTRRRQAWSDLHRVMGLRLPELVRPAWVKAAVILGSCAIGTAIFVFGRAALVTAFLTTLVAMYVLFQATKPLAVMFHRKFATVGGLTKCILQKNFGAISDSCQRANAEEVWDTLRCVIVEQLGVRPDDVTKEARFVEDFGCG
jgi:acyl carrier protein